MNLFAARPHDTAMDGFPLLPDFPNSIDVNPSSVVCRLKVGMDLVQISRIQASLEKFGDRFMQRIFTEHEMLYAISASVLQAERLAARFAAKEATLKALGLAGKGVAWRDMEVFRFPDGRCELRLYGRAFEFAKSLGVIQTALSLSHDGDYAAAIVAAVVSEPSMSASTDSI